MTTKYILIKSYISGMHADSGFYTIGIPALNSFAGAFHQIQRQLTNKVPNIKINKFLIGFKDIALYKGKKMIESKSQSKYIPKKSDYVKKYSNIEKFFINGYFIFILELSYSPLDLHIKLDEYVISTINFTKIAGGTLNQPIIYLKDDFKKIIKYFKNSDYFILSDESHIIREKTSIKEILSYISYYDTFIPNVNKLYIPIVNGYSLLENPNNKDIHKNTLRNNSYKHAFAEPTLTLARLIPINHLVFSDDKTFKTFNILWTYCSEFNSYILKGTTFQ